MTLVSALAATMYSSAILVEGIKWGTFWGNYSEFWPLVKEVSIKDISIFSSGCHFVQQNRTV